jgi:hypothetical protein
MVNHGRGGNRAEGGRKGLERQAAFNKRVPLAFYRGGLPALPPDSPPAISLRWRETMGWCGGLAGWLARKRSRILPPCVRFFLIIFFCSRSVFRGHRAAHDFGTAPEKTRLRTRIDSVASDPLPPRDRSVIMHWRSSVRDRLPRAVVRRARLATLRDCAPLGAAHLPREESQRSRTQTRDSSMMRCGTTTRLVNDEIRHPRVPRRRGWREGQETQPEILLLIDPSKSGLS